MNFLKKQFKNIKKIKYILIILLVLILLFFISIKVYGNITGFWDIGYKVNNSDSGEIYVGGAEGSGGECHRITNTSGINYFIPSKTTNEWNAFDNNKPNNVFTSSCCTDTCSSEGYECDSQMICGTLTDCGSCGSNAECSSGNCVCDSGFADCDNNNSCECNINTHHCLAGSCVANGTPCVPSAGNSCGTACTPGTINCSGTCVTHNASYGISCGADDEICDGDGSCCDPIYTPDMCPDNWCGSYDNGCNGTVSCNACPLNQECNQLTGQCQTCIPEPCETTSGLYCNGMSYDDSCGNSDACVGTNPTCSCDSCYTQDDCPTDSAFCGSFDNAGVCALCGAMQGVTYPDTVVCGDCNAYGNNNWYCGSGYQCTCNYDSTCPLSDAYCSDVKYYSNCGPTHDDNDPDPECSNGPCCTGTHQACSDSSNYCGIYTDTICNSTCFGTKACATGTYCSNNDCCFTQQSCDYYDVCAGTYDNLCGSTVTCTSAACESGESCGGDSLCHAGCGTYPHGFCAPWQSTSYCCCDGAVIEAYSCP